MRMQTHQPCHVYSHGLALRQLLAKATRISPLGFACSLASTRVVPTAPEAVAFRTASLIKPDHRLDKNFGRCPPVSKTDKRHFWWPRHGIVARTFLRHLASLKCKGFGDCSSVYLLQVLPCYTSCLTIHVLVSGECF